MSEQAFVINGKTVNSSNHIQSAFPKATKACSGCQRVSKAGFICGCAGQRQERNIPHPMACLKRTGSGALRDPEAVANQDLGNIE